MVEFYKKYFLDVAIAHADIKHAEDERAFFYIKDKYNLKAFDEAIKSAGKTPALLLERFTFDIGGGTKQNKFRHLNCRFSVLCNTEAGDESSIEAAEQKAEDIIISIINQMEADFAGGEGKIQAGNKIQRVVFEVENIQVDPIGPILNKYYGMTVGFKWKCPLKVATV